MVYLVKSLLFDSVSQEREVAEDLHGSNADRLVHSVDSYNMLEDFLESSFGFGSSSAQNLPTAAGNPLDPEPVFNCFKSSARVACQDPGEPKDGLSCLEEMVDLKDRTLRSNKTADAIAGKALSLSDRLPLA